MKADNGRCSVKKTVFAIFKNILSKLENPGSLVFRIAASKVYFCRNTKLKVRWFKLKNSFLYNWYNYIQNLRIS